MYVIEVRPKQAWRGLRFPKEEVPRTATVTTRHTATSHWFQKGTATWVVTHLRPEVRSAGRLLEIPGDRWRIVACACAPTQLR